jgi:uncharacterized protein (TIGR02147 family)
MEIFDYKDYREYIKAWIAAQAKKGRGQRAALAEAVRSPVSHISQVLSCISQLNLEQAEEANEFFSHNAEEAEFFLLLVQLGRAGTPKLRRRLESQMQKMQERRLRLKDRLGVKEQISSEHQAKFYSSWHYVAVHILLTIEKFQTKEAIAKRLKLSIRKTSEILDFLLRIGLVKQENSHYLVGNARMHLGNDSSSLSRHHTNWRMQAIQSFDRENADEALHYSSVVSISEVDAQKIRSLLVKAIENTKALIKPSKEEELYSFCLDFFQV